MILGERAWGYLDFPYIDRWKEYYVRNFSTINEKLAALKNGMDERSKEIVDLTFERNMLLAHHDRYKQAVLYDTAKVFKDWEFEDSKKQQRIIKEYFKNIDDLDEFPLLYENKYLFASDNGLKNLPQKVHNYIKGKDFIDGGALSGDSALVMAKYQPGKIYSFEPVSENFALLQKVLKAKNLTQVVPVKRGLGDKQKQAVCCQKEGSSTTLPDFLTPGAGAETIEIITTDAFAKEHNLNIGLIKLDIEGCELAAIRGAVNSIKKSRPVLLISVYHLPEDFFEIKPLIEKEIGGYVFKMEKLIPLSPAAEILLIAYPQEIL